MARNDGDWLAVDHHGAEESRKKVSRTVRTSVCFAYANGVNALYTLEATFGNGNSDHGKEAIPYTDEMLNLPCVLGWRA
ncbi:MAG: hypothetical protein HQL74_12825 [Magnetococcales bacterium]|nr:hypothetical protein [Magnetococcales bacterium]